MTNDSNRNRILSTVCQGSTIVAPSASRRIIVKGLVAAPPILLARHGHAAPLELKFPHLGTPTSPYHVFATKFSELVAKNSNGEVKVTVIPGGQMGDQKDMYAGLKLGTIDFYMNDIGTLSYESAGKDFAVMFVPYIFKDMDTFHKFRTTSVYTGLVDQYEKNGGVKIVGYLLDRSPRQLTTANREVRKPADMKGLKLRMPEIPILISVFNAYGSNSTVMPFVEAINAMRQGVVDGQDNGIDLIKAFKMWEYQKYYTQTDHCYMGVLLLANSRKWTSWSADMRAMLQKSVREAYASEAPAFWESEKSGVEEMRANKMITILDPDKEAFRQISLTVSRKYDGDLWRKGLLDEVIRATT